MDTKSLPFALLVLLFLQFLTLNSVVPYKLSLIVVGITIPLAAVAIVLDSKYLVTIAFCATFSLILINYYWNSLCVETIDFTKVESIEGRALSDSTLSRSGNWVTTVRVESLRTKEGTVVSSSGNVMVISKGEFSMWAYDYVVSEGYFVDNSLFIATSIKRSSPIEAITSVRAKLFARASKVCENLDPNASFLVKALVLGLQEELSMVKEYSISSGAAHVLALSGMHLSLIIVVVMGMGKRLFSNEITFFLALIGALCYVVVVGTKPSLLRALFLFVLSHYLKERGTLSVLTIAWALQLLLFPFSMLTLSSLLSYSSLFALASLSLPIAQRVSVVTPLKIALPLSASLAATIGTALLSLSFFGNWYPIGIILSLIIIPLVTLLFFFSALYLLFPIDLFTLCVEFLATLYSNVVEWGNYHSSNTTFWWWIIILIGVVLSLLLCQVGSTQFKKRALNRYRVDHIKRFSKQCYTDQFDYSQPKGEKFV